MRYIYSILLYLVAPLVPFYLKKRGKKNKEYNKHWNERFGVRLVNKSLKPIIWIHAVSVGETRAIAHIVELLQTNYPQYQVLITNMTPTGRMTAKALYSDVIHHYVPYDLPSAVISFYKTFKPKICLIAETEIWPNLIHYASKYQVPVFLINARLSNKSFTAYNRVKFLIKPILNQFTGILCQDQNSQNNFLSLGYSGNTSVIGNTKFDFVPDHKQIELANKLKKGISNKKVVIFASTRDCEEDMFIPHLKNKEYLVIIVPRHLERFKLVEQMLINHKITYVKRSDNTPITNDTQVFLGNSMGEMFMYYQISDIAIMGGSFGNFGSQNLIEPILLNKPVIFGPSTFNFTQIARDVINDGCGIQVNNSIECLDVIDRLLWDDTKYNQLKNNCKTFAIKYTGASERVVNMIDKYL